MRRELLREATQLNYADIDAMNYMSIIAYNDNSVNLRVTIRVITALLLSVSPHLPFLLNTNSH